MAKGIIYVMTSVVPGLIKIGKTQLGGFENRMYNLERNGYFNVGGLKRAFAIEVEDYDEKEKLLDDIFSKSRLDNTELFALDVDLVIQLLSSFEGHQVFPEIVSKEESFKEASRERSEIRDADLIPNGIYYLSRKLKKNGALIEARMSVDDGCFIVKKGEKVALTEAPGLNEGISEARRANVDEEGIVIEDTSFNSPSAAGCFVIGGSCNGWACWKTGPGPKGKSIDIYRKKRK